MTQTAATHVSPAARILLRCLTTPVRMPADEAVDWESVLQQARENRVIPLLYARLKSAEAGAIPPDVLRALREEYQENAARTLRLAAELCRLLDLLAGQGIAAVPFKGLTLAAEYYGGVSLREAGDIDLLIHRADIVNARRILMDTGLRPIFPTASESEARYLAALSGRRECEYLLSHCEHHLIDEEGRVNVDLHWAITLREFSLPLDPEGLWSRLQTTTIAGKPTPTLAAEDLLFVLCINGGKDCWRRLDRVCDVAEVMRARTDLDWDRLAMDAASVGGLRILLLGVLLAANLLGAAVPERVTRELSNDPAVRRLADEVEQALVREPPVDEPSRAVMSLFHLRLRERKRDRLAYCLAHLRPGVGDWVSLPLPRGLSFLHYVLRPFRLIGRYGLERLRPPGR